MPPDALPVSPAITIQGWLPLLTLVVTVLASPLAVSVYNNRRADRVAKRTATATLLAAERVQQQLEETNRKVDETAAKHLAKLDRIDEQTNGRLHAALAALDQLRQRAVKQSESMAHALDIIQQLNAQISGMGGTPVPPPDALLSTDPPVPPISGEAS